MLSDEKYSEYLAHVSCFIFDQIEMCIFLVAPPQERSGLASHYVVCPSCGLVVRGKLQKISIFRNFVVEKSP